jgi:predicted ATPase
VERAQLVHPDFHLTKQNSSLVAEICQRLDGLPLAIELASARLNVLSVKEIATLLGDRFSLLTGSRRTTLPRHQTLRGTLDWSYALLKPEQQAAFRRLSAFAGGWTLEAGAAVCFDQEIESEKMLDLLANLVDKSLVVSEWGEAQTHYRFLETVREYAHEKLVGAGEQDTIKGRHLMFFKRLVGPVTPELDVEQQARRFDRMVRERENLRAALDWALAGNALQEGVQLAIDLSGFWLESAASTEAVHYLEKGLALIPKLTDPAQRILELKLQMALGAALMAHKGYAAPEVGRAYSRAEELAGQVGDGPQLWPVLWGLWNYYEVCGELETAGSIAEELSSLAQRSGDHDAQLEAQRVLGDLLFWRGEFQESQLHSDAAVQLYDEGCHGLHVSLVGEDPGVCALQFAALADWHLGLLQESLDRIGQGLALARRLGHTFTLVQVLQMAAILRQMQGDWQASREAAEEGIDISQREGYPLFVALAASLRGRALVEQGQTHVGIGLIRQAVRDFQLTGAQILTPYLLSMLAAALKKQGQVEEALDVVDRALALVESSGERWCQSELHRLRGELSMQQTHEDAGHAEESFRWALEIARGQQARMLELRAALSLHRLLNTGQTRNMLSNIYSEFGTQDDAADLKSARILLQAP